MKCLRLVLPWDPEEDQLVGRIAIMSTGGRFYWHPHMLAAVFRTGSLSAIKYQLTTASSALARCLPTNHRDLVETHGITAMLGTLLDRSPELHPCTRQTVARDMHYLIDTIIARRCATGSWYGTYTPEQIQDFMEMKRNLVFYPGEGVAIQIRAQVGQTLALKRDRLLLALTLPNTEPEAVRGALAPLMPALSPMLHCEPGERLDLALSVGDVTMTRTDVIGMVSALYQQKTTAGNFLSLLDQAVWFGTETGSWTIPEIEKIL